MNKKYITTTLPYINSKAHIGHAFEFVLADIISEFYKLKFGKENVFLNVGVDEHGLKIYQKALELGYNDTKEYCDDLSEIWKNFCKDLKIDYDNFYRTTSAFHAIQTLSFYGEIKDNIFRKNYEGKYCVGCESFKTEKELNNDICPIHFQKTESISEENLFFNISKYKNQVQDVLIDKTLSNELKNLIAEDFDLSISRKNVPWGVRINEDEVFYVWAEALLNYLFAIKYYENREYFNEYWSNSLQICGTDNLKFQAYIFQSLLLAAGIPQTKEILVHGTILDSKGIKMSKTLGNVIDPIEQKEKYGLSPLRYYLFFGLNTFDKSSYDEDALVKKWNSEIVNGFGNLITRTLHIIDINNINPAFISESDKLSEEFCTKLHEDFEELDSYFFGYDFSSANNKIRYVIDYINQRYDKERPFDKECENKDVILSEIFFYLERLSKYFKIILKDEAEQIDLAFKNKKKVVLFNKL